MIEAGYTRLLYIFGGYFFTFMVEVLSGYMRGYGMSLLPASVALVGISGVRILWIYTVFRPAPSFSRIMAAFPVSMCVTAIALICAVFVLRP